MAGKKIPEIPDFINGMLKSADSISQLLNPEKIHPRDLLQKIHDDQVKLECLTHEERRELGLYQSRVVLVVLAAELNQTACLKRTQMDLPETGVAANSPAMGVKGIGQAGQPVNSRVGDYAVSTVHLPRYGVILPSGTPYAPQSSQVEGGGQQGPFGSDVANTLQQEPP